MLGQKITIITVKPVRAALSKIELQAIYPLTLNAEEIKEEFCYLFTTANFLETKFHFDWFYFESFIHTNYQFCQ